MENNDPRTMDMVRQWLSSHIDSLGEYYNQYKQWGEKNRETMQGIPGLSQILGLSDSIADLSQVPGADLGFTGGTMPASYLLRTAVKNTGKEKVLNINMLHSDSPHESVRILRDLLGRAEREGVEKLTFTPVAGSSKGTTPMAEMIKRFGIKPEQAVYEGVPVDTLRKLVKRSSYPPVSQESLNELSPEVLRIIDSAQDMGGLSTYSDLITLLQKKYPQKNYKEVWNMSRELFNLAQAKGALKLK